MHICELGAGSGRFAFHFLQRLIRLSQQHGVPPESFRYVLTDFAESNLDAWAGHPRFRPLFESGILDRALFDVNESAELALRVSGERIAAGDLEQPLVVIANYLFDSVPQALFYFEDGVASRGHVSLSLATEDDPATLDVAGLLESLHLEYEYQALDEPSYGEPELDGLLEFYRQELDDAHVLFPAAGLRCLGRLKALSRQGLFLLSADKGEHRLERIGWPQPPQPVCHGSFSLSVNYHAFRAACERTGGMALLEEYPHASIEAVGLLMVDQATEHTETRRAWENRVLEFSPGEYLTVSLHARAHASEMTLAAMLAYVRQGLCDSHLFAHYLPRLLALAPEFDADERDAVARMIEQVWEMYFPLGEDCDLTYGMACLLYEMDDYPRAVAYFERSLEIYGPHVGTYFNMAACYNLLGRPEQTEPLLRKLLRTDPGNTAAQELLDGLKIGFGRN